MEKIKKDKRLLNAKKKYTFPSMEEVYAEFSRNPNRTIPKIAEALGCSQSYASNQLSRWFQIQRDIAMEKRK